jgi:2'-5' RNA ligase
MPEKRAIHLFPRGISNPDIIQQIRSKYDPISALIEPHITLVFPFESEISTNDLEAHIDAVLPSYEPFLLKFSGYSVSHDNYLFLDLIQGKNHVVEIHDKLYTGILFPYLKPWKYVPHITLGKFYTSQEAHLALQSLPKGIYFNCTIDSVFVEAIGKDESSTIQIHHHFNPDHSW